MDDLDNAWLFVSECEKFFQSKANGERMETTPHGGMQGRALFGGLRAEGCYAGRCSADCGAEVRNTYNLKSLLIK